MTAVRVFGGVPLHMTKQPLMVHMVEVTEYRVALARSMLMMLGVLVGARQPLTRSQMALPNVVYSHGHKLRYWGLIEHATPLDERWQATDAGVSFVQGRSQVPLHAILLQGTVIRYEGPMVEVHDRLPTKTYEEYRIEYIEAFRRRGA